MSPRRKEPPSGRPRKRRRSHERHLIVCGAKVTEPDYFRILLDDLDIRGWVKVDCSLAGKDPFSLVRGAAKLLRHDAVEAARDGSEPLSAVWVVTDVDDFQNLALAQLEASRVGVSLIITNPCFEVWLIDHVKTCAGSCYSTVSCQRCAAELGVTKSTDAKRTGKGRMKAIAREMIAGKHRSALENAKRHNTEQKARVRANNPDDVGAYRVWTDVVGLVGFLDSAASRQ